MPFFCNGTFWFNHYIRLCLLKLSYTCAWPIILSTFDSLSTGNSFYLFQTFYVLDACTLLLLLPGMFKIVSEINSFISWSGCLVSRRCSSEGHSVKWNKNHKSIYCCSLLLTAIDEAISLKVITQGYIHLLLKFLCLSPDVFTCIFFHKQEYHFPVPSDFVTTLVIKYANSLHYSPFLVVWCDFSVSYSSVSHVAISFCSSTALYKLLPLQKLSLAPLKR